MKEITLNVGSREAYVMFNNLSMREDCLRFRRMLS